MRVLRTYIAISTGQCDRTVLVKHRSDTKRVEHRGNVVHCHAESRPNATATTDHNVLRTDGNGPKAGVCFEDCEGGIERTETVVSWKSVDVRIRDPNCSPGGGGHESTRVAN